jgi:protein-S-isoprenylcysteine O-methyltransferase Ste14
MKVLLVEIVAVLYEGWEMSSMSERRFSWKDHVPATLSSILFIAQIVVGIYLLPEASQIDVLAYAGVGFYCFSGIVFGALPVFEFRKKCGVQKGQSYIHTTKLVDTGIYSVVRHPQYVTFIMWAISGMLLFQHWIVILLGVPVIPLTYIDLIRADKACVERFGDDYKAYMKKVPRANFLLGIIRRFRKSET